MQAHIQSHWKNYYDGWFFGDDGDDVMVVKCGPNSSILSMSIVIWFVVEITVMKSGNQTFWIRDETKPKKNTKKEKEKRRGERIAIHLRIFAP